MSNFAADFYETKIVKKIVILVAVTLALAVPAGAQQLLVDQAKKAISGLTMTVDSYALASFNEAASAWQTAAGDYKVFFGASVADIRATGSFKIAKPASWPVAPVCLPQQPVGEIAVR